MKTDKMKSQTSDNTFGEARLQRKIFVAMLVLSLGSALLLVGCERSAAGGASVDKRVADLEKQVAALQEQSRDVRVKLKAANGFGNSPLGDFFASPEFWQCTYDSSWADCSSRCAQQTAARRRLCFDKPEGRIAESAAASQELALEEIRAFYSRTLPQMGWVRTADGSSIS